MFVSVNRRVSVIFLKNVMKMFLMIKIGCLADNNIHSDTQYLYRDRILIPRLTLLKVNIYVKVDFWKMSL